MGYNHSDAYSVQNNRFSFSDIAKRREEKFDTTLYNVKTLQCGFNSKVEIG